MTDEKETTTSTKEVSEQKKDYSKVNVKEGASSTTPKEGIKEPKNNLNVNKIVQKTKFTAFKFGDNNTSKPQTEGTKLNVNPAKNGMGNSMLMKHGRNKMPQGEASQLKATPPNPPP